MSSSRLPGKVMLRWNGLTMIEIMIRRVQQCKLINQIVVATTVNPQDDSLCEHLVSLGIDFYRGPEDDVLKRVYEAAVSFKAESIVSLTADCPLIDPLIIEDCIQIYLHNNADFVTNCHFRSFPDGMDVQVFSLETLADANLNAIFADEREHTTLYLRRNTRLSKLINVVANSKYNNPNLGLTLDEEMDAIFIRNILDNLESPFQDNCSEILDTIRDKELIILNSSVKRKLVK